MGRHRIVKRTIIYAALLSVIGAINYHYSFIRIAGIDELSNLYATFITISTVFAGFSFTALGLLLGLSSETLIQKISNTSIVIKKIQNIIFSIVFFVISSVLSLVSILKLDSEIVNCIETYFKIKILENVNSFEYIFNVGFLLLGIFYFVFSVYELYDLLKRIYSYNSAESQAMIKAAKKELERNRNKLHKDDAE